MSATSSSAAASPSPAPKAWGGKTPLPFRLVEQALWATLAALNMVRRKIVEAARTRRIDPRRISFTDVVIVIVATWRAEFRSKADSRRAKVRLCDDLAARVLDRWRRPWQWPRVVRIKSNQYPSTKPSRREPFRDVSTLLHGGRAKCACFRGIDAWLHRP